MAHAFTPGLMISKETSLRKRRDLPLARSILVKPGDTVTAEQIIGHASLEGDLRIVRVAEILGVSPEQVTETLQVTQGVSVQEGEILAEMRGLWGLFKTTVTSPIHGTVELISTATGHIGVRAPARRLDLRAYVSGRVVSVEENRSITIETKGAYIQGIFGVGGERTGILSVLALEIADRVTEEHIPAECRGAVLVGGHSPSIGALRKAAANGAVGFITGSIDDVTLREYVGYDIGIALTGDEAVSMTVIITEGFGAIAMSSRIADLTKELAGAACSINGATQVRAGALRPELIAPDAHETADIHVQPDRDTSSGLSVGSRIRLIRVPYFGEFATVTSLPHEPAKIPTGAWTRVLEAELDSGEIVTVPRANVERV